MSNVSNSPFARPMSVMSLLADQMELSYIGNSKSHSIEYKSISKQPSNFSSSAPTHRHSIPGIGFNSNAPQNDFLCHECPVLMESDVSSPQLPPKRLCHSSITEGIARPIPIKGDIKSTIFPNIRAQSTQIQCTTHQCQTLNPRPNVMTKTTQKSFRPIISPHYKKSAFTPTRSLTSPQTTSSDYSVSPDIESPIYRPASNTSSGFNDCSQQSLLIDPNYSPESNQTSTCATIVSTNVPDPNICVFPRCHSQPCDVQVLRSNGNRSVTLDADRVCTCHESSLHFPPQGHTPMKRRYPSHRQARSMSHSESTNSNNFDYPLHVHCPKPLPNSADTSPNAPGPTFIIPKRDGYFFGGGRNYLSSLPRIASSPPPIAQLVDQQTLGLGHRQRMGSNSSSLSTSTTTDTNTPTTVSNVQIISIGADTNVTYTKDVLEDVEMAEGLVLENRRSRTPYDPMVAHDSGSVAMSTTIVACPSTNSDDASDMTTKSSYSANSDGTNVSCSINSESSRSEFRDVEDPPEIGGLCFSQLMGSPVQGSYEPDDNYSFQELDLDQIELD